MLLSQSALSQNLYVATNGNDAWSGTQPSTNETRSDGPFATLERARKEIHHLRKYKRIPPAGITVLVRGGHYRVTGSFSLTAADSGTAKAPITYRAYPGETPVFCGGVTLKEFKKVTDPAILTRLIPEAADKIRQIALNAHGLTTVVPFQLGGFAYGDGFRTHPVMELFFNGAPLPRSRWPKADEFMHIESVSTNRSYTSHGLVGSKSGPITYSGDRPTRWLDEKYALLRGYWFWDWADSYERIAAINPARHEIKFARPYSKYGYRKGQRFCAVNLLCEISEPGEWYIDEARGMLYLYPPADLSQGTLELSATPTPLVHFKNVSHVTLQGLTWELCATDAILIQSGKQCKLVGCTVRRCAGNGVEVRGGTNHELRSCNIFSMGRGGTVISGGNRRTLKPGGHVIENCHIYDLSRVDRTYTPAIHAQGVGHRIAHNLMHDIPSSAIRLDGNDHIVEYNEICNVVLESDDQGGIDMFGDPTYRGNIIRNNYWHHIGQWEKSTTNLREGQAGIRLDDAISGVLIEGNLFEHCGVGHFGAIQIHGGKDNTIISNVFIHCRAAISFTPWGEQRWRDFLAKPIREPEIEPALATNRYPELTHLAENPDSNLITRNVFCDCDQISLRPSGKSRIVDNIVTDQNPGYSLDKIGLYCNPDRPTLPTELIQESRKGKLHH